MDGPIAIKPQNRRERRHDIPPVAVAVHARTVSRRGLLSDLYIVRCCECGCYRRHQSLGLRVCPCGARYRLVEGAVIA